LPAFESEEEVTVVPLKFGPYESMFIVFEGKGRRSTSNDVDDNFPPSQTLTEITTPWAVTFEADKYKRGPSETVAFPDLQSWSDNADERIRFYSGAAVYNNVFTLADKPAGKIYVDLDTGYVMAKVKINGQYAGGVWTPPYRVDITDYVKQGENTIEVEVVSTWVNRLIGDARLPREQRIVDSYHNEWSESSRLREAGLVGTVKIVQ
jgi:hypothetical protein